MTQLMVNTVAHHYNMTGKGSKMGFGALNLHRAVSSKL